MHTNSLDALDTPCLIVDTERLERNVARAATYAAQHGLGLRPHVKTHKSLYVAQAQLRAGAKGLTCATLAEASVMQAAATDLLLAYPPVGQRRAAQLAALRADARIGAMVDSASAVVAAAYAAEEAARTIDLYVELDVGMRRTGVRSAHDAVMLAQRIHAESSLRFAGLAFYPGHIRAPNAGERTALAVLNAELAEVLSAFAAANIDIPAVSGGSTPTLWHSHELVGVTEIRPGTYVYNDRSTVASGACAWDDCALTVLATVVSTAVPGQVVIDAGAKAIGREPLRGADGVGYGVVQGIPDAVITRMSEEHGIVEQPSGRWCPAIGERIRIIPNHVCIAVHLHDRVHAERDGIVGAGWPVDARGREAATIPSTERRPTAGRAVFDS